MLPLAFVKSGDFVKILKVKGKDDAKKHLNDLGFVEGTVCAVISSHSWDVILNVKDSRLAITKEMADRIMIDMVDKVDYMKSKQEII